MTSTTIEHSLVRNCYGFVALALLVYVYAVFEMYTFVYPRGQHMTHAHWQQTLTAKALRTLFCRYDALSPSLYHLQVRAVGPLLRRGGGGQEETRDSVVLSVIDEGDRA